MGRGRKRGDDSIERGTEERKRRGEVVLGDAGPGNHGRSPGFRLVIL